MSELKSEHHSRRKFLSFGMLAGAGLLTGEVTGQTANESGETVKMLTQEGKLVEVDKALLPPPSLKKQASKKEVLRWIHPEE